MSDNPLQSFYRNREVYVELPSEYRYFSEKPKVNNGEIGIMPMSTRDEMLLKIPDTLYNGEALFEIIKSVAPDIVDPYETVLPDLDIILLATRIATYGKDMEIQSRCSHCNTASLYSIDISSVLSKLQKIPKDYDLEIDGLVIRLKPNTVQTITANRLGQLEIEKVLSGVKADEELPSIMEKFKLSLEKTTAANLAVYADSVESVTMPDGTVVKNIEHILEWLTNSNAKTLSQIRKHSARLNQNGIQKVFDFTCTNEACGQNFKGPVEFNPAFFFRID
jgi:hypothetical protein